MSGGPCGWVPAAVIPSTIRGAKASKSSRDSQEVDDSPATIDRPRCVEEEPVRWCAIGVGVIVSLVELLLGDPWELDADADSHPQPLFR